MRNEQTGENRPRRWSIRFAVEGDLRFMSHLDVMRAIERIATRAGLPLRYSQGFNPRPRISVPQPRPVGVATRCDMLILTVDGDLAAEDILERMNQQAPKGMRFFEAKRLQTKRPGRVCKAVYELGVHPDRQGDLQDRLGRLRQLDSWPVERLVKASSRGPGLRNKQIDVKPLVDALEIQGQSLRLVLVRVGESWARPGEVLRLLDIEQDLSALVRTSIECET